MLSTLIFFSSGSAPAFDFYVDPAAGNDANAGTAAEPFATLTAALTASSDGDTIGVKAGTTVIESDTVYIDNGRRVGSYGGAARFKLDVRQHLSAPTWSPVAGTSNVYETTATHRELPPSAGIQESGAHYAIWDSDTSLQWIAGGADIASNTATVDATPGSFTVYKDGSTSQDPRLDSSGTLYRYRVHLPAGGSPAGRDISIADRLNIVFVSGGSTLENAEFVGNNGKDASGTNSDGTATLTNCRALDVPVHGFVGSPVTMTDWSATSRLTPGLPNSAGKRNVNVANLYRDTSDLKAEDSSVTYGSDHENINYVFFGHTGAQTDRIGNDLIVDGQGHTFDNVTAAYQMANGANPLWSSVLVRNMVLTNAFGMFFPGAGPFTARNVTFQSLNPLPNNTRLVQLSGGTVLLEDCEWEFLSPFSGSTRHWLTQVAQPGSTLTLRRCTDHARNSNRNAHMRRGTGHDAFTLVVEDCLLGNLMDLAAGTNWPTGGVTATNSTLGFGNRTQAQVEADMTTAGVPFSFTNCTFIDLTGNVLSTP